MGSLCWQSSFFVVTTIGYFTRKYIFCSKKGPVSMIMSNSHSPEYPWVMILVPNRSLTVIGFYSVLGMVIGASLLIGLGFSLAGAWPVIGFLGLDVLLIYWALTRNYRILRRSERIKLTREELEITSFCGSVCLSREVFQPYWTKVDLNFSREDRNRLVLRSSGKEIELGSFLSPDQKSAIANRLRSALANLVNTESF